MYILIREGEQERGPVWAEILKKTLKVTVVFCLIPDI